MFQVLKVLLIKICEIQSLYLLSLVILLAFTSADIFQKFLELEHSTLSAKKIFITNFSFLMPRQILKNSYASAKALNAALVTLLIESLKIIIWLIVLFFKWFEHGQTSNVIWLCATWLLIFGLEVSNKKPLFITEPASIELKFHVKKI